MKKGVVLLVLGLLSWSAAGNGFAGPFRGQRPVRQAREYQQQLPPSRDSDENREKDGEKNGEKNGQGGGQQGNRGQEFRRNEPGAAPQMPGGRAGARMSIEERQRLRRQINEAGQSLYTPPGQSGNK